MDVWRPCDTVESAVAWTVAIERAHGPSCLLFTRQNVPFVPRDAAAVVGHRARRLRARRLRRGAVGPRASSSSPPGRKSALAIGARDALAKEGVAVRVVSMPCTSAFDRQDAAYRASVLPPASRASRSKPASPTAGANTSAPTTIRMPASSASTPSANPRRAVCCSSISASPSTMWSPPSSACSDGMSETRHPPRHAGRRARHRAGARRRVAHDVPAA